MGISHFLNILRQPYRQFPIGVKAVIFSAGMTHPGTGMYLVNSHGLCVHVFTCRAFFHPFAVCPLKSIDIRHCGGIARPQFRIICKRVCFVKFSAIRSFNIKFIQISHFHPWDKQLVNSHGLQTGHFIRLFLPLVKISYHGNFCRIRRPYRKVHTFFPFICNGVRTQLFINIIMCCLSKIVHIQI